MTTMSKEIPTIDVLLFDGACVSRWLTTGEPAAGQLVMPVGL